MIGSMMTLVIMVTTLHVLHATDEFPIRLADFHKSGKTTMPT
jgi:hypothetical protein